LEIKNGNEKKMKMQKTQLQWLTNK
jgi:hypothetical protein